MPQFSKGGRDVQSTFSQATDLFYQIRDTEGAAKKKRLADERKALMDANPSVKYIDDNIKNIIDQLEKNNKATRKGNCP
jgi:DNA-binding transcriptional regulator GbsR (MarR family)